jgi:trk system potassium uptake protein TrkA
VAATLFRTPKKIARIRSSEYLENQALFSPTNIPVDKYISPEGLVTDYIAELIYHPGAFQILDFANKQVRMVGIRVKQQGFLVDRHIEFLHTQLDTEQVRIAAIFRDGESVETKSDTVIKKNDEVFFIAAREEIDNMIQALLHQDQEEVRGVMIAGGGNIGIKLASKLEKTNQVKVIERSKSRARALSDILEKAFILKGDAADEDLLLEENIENMDVFVALTNSEEANILSSMLAKKLGCKKVMALINKASYSGLMEVESIDVAISPQQITIGFLLEHVRKGDVVKVHSLKTGNVEVLEAVVHEHTSSKIVGKKVDNIELPKGASIVAVISKEGALKALHRTTTIESDDHVIVLITDKHRIADIEALF